MTADLKAQFASLRREHTSRCQCHPESGHVNFNGDDPPECSCEDDPDEINARLASLESTALAALDRAEAGAAELRVALQSLADWDNYKGGALGEGGWDRVRAALSTDSGRLGAAVIAAAREVVATCACGCAVREKLADAVRALDAGAGK